MKGCAKTVPKIILLIILFGTTIFSAAYSQTDEFTSSSDEFTEFKESGDTFTDDEFGEFMEFNDTTSEEFVEFSEFENTTSEDCSNCSSNCSESKQQKNLYWIFGILGVTILAGFLVRYKTTRNLRGLFLIASLVILGIWRGACPCPISSFHNLVLLGVGVDVPWQSLLWFLGLIPITYFFGRIYCGWICHLGALQEFLFLPGKVKILQSEKSQKIMRGVRITLLILLIAQIFITKTNIFKHYDPFKAAFNLFATNTLSWVLLGLLLVSSLFIYRPFCKTACPIGLMLGWVSKIPGARIIGNNGSCTGCKTCDTTCKIRAITRDKQFSKLDNQECIVCGSCMTECRKDALTFFRNNKSTHNDQVVCKNINS